MTKSAAISRADLLRHLSVHGNLTDAAAEAFGFERTEPAAPREPIRPPPRDDGAQPPAPDRLPPTIDDDATATPRPRLTFLMAVRAETLAPPPPRTPPTNPITDAELAVPWGHPGLPLQPLIRWARLAPFLRSRLGSVAPGHRLDLRRLQRDIARGRPLGILPRLPRQTWAAQAVVLWDQTGEMTPFTADAIQLVRRLRRERGPHGLLVRPVRELPHPRVLGRIAHDTPVLALSALGQFQDAPGIAGAWLALARHLAFQDHPLTAICPCPRDRWKHDVTTGWPAAVWDRRPHLPRRGGLRPPRVPMPSPSPATGRLLDFLSPATLIEPALLRSARLRLGPAANVGTEWDVWFHPDGWQSLESCGFMPGPIYEARLAWRHSLAGPDVELARDIGDLIRRQHESCSPVIAAEAVLRACLTGTPDDTQMTKVNDLLTRVVERLRLMSESPGDPAGRRSGLAPWFEAMVGRLSDRLLGHTAVAKLIADGLALARLFQPSPHTVLRAGVWREAYLAQTGAAGPQLPRPVDVRPVLRGAELVLLPDTADMAPTEKPLGLLRIGTRHVHLSPDQPRETHTLELPAAAQALVLPAPPSPTPFSLATDRQRLRFENVERPAWARRMAYDRYGICAGFTVGAAVFVLRWIPPGRFLMGSPADEPGRQEREGPQHEVTLTHGFWLGETPVTQAQWKAVVEEVGKASRTVKQRNPGQEALSPNPSHFRGPAELPVESVSWQDSTAYCDLLNVLLGPQLPQKFQFHLPTEAQWEYACRAGTEPALYTGGITIRGANDAPELDAIAWYGGNSGNGLDVENPYDSKGWPEMQHPHDKAGTHRVKLKSANGWGLHDMIGNVWEWCLDGRRDYREASETDPIGPAKGDSVRAFRGGSWLDQARDCRSAYRYWNHPGDRWGNQGLRLAAGQEPGAERVSPARRAG